MVPVKLIILICLGGFGLLILMLKNARKEKYSEILKKLGYQSLDPNETLTLLPDLNKSFLMAKGRSFKIEQAYFKHEENTKKYILEWSFGSGNDRVLYKRWVFITQKSSTPHGSFVFESLQKFGRISETDLLAAAFQPLIIGSKRHYLKTNEMSRILKIYGSNIEKLAAEQPNLCFEKHGDFFVVYINQSQKLKGGLDKLERQIEHITSLS